MVVALKELSIRGDFRTTVEYLIKLLETESFQQNRIDTGWLDRLIAEKVQVWHISFTAWLYWCMLLPSPESDPGSFQLCLQLQLSRAFDSDLFQLFMVMPWVEPFTPFIAVKAQKSKPLCFSSVAENLFCSCTICSLDGSLLMPTVTRCCPDH